MGFAVVDAQDIPYDDASFDAITMAYGIRNMPDRPRALAEMHRVLRPGGSFTCLEFSTPPNRVWRALYHFYLRHLIPFWGKLVTGDSSGFVYLAKLIADAGLAGSAGEARRLIDGGGVKVDGEALAPKSYNVDPALLDGAVIQVGKRKFARIVPAS